MTDWWEEPYPGGKMVSVPGFPRALYPPDAGKEASTDGPDVEAYKRTVWRAGRWPGPASSFDRTFSNGFSHGKSGNVGESGIAGIQRQQGLDPTGNVGEKTFNTLRSIKIPKGLPNAGQMAMDAKAQSLIVLAWEEFGGKEPEPPPTTSLRLDALKEAIHQLGVKESPPGSNQTLYCDWYGMIGPWCAMFVTWCYEMAGDSDSFDVGKDYAYVPYIVNDARSKLNGLSVTSSPVPGDLVCFDWSRDGVFDHVGFFEEWGGNSPSSFFAIEGNTAVGDDSDGGEVMRRNRDTQAQSTVFVRVAES